MQLGMRAEKTMLDRCWICKERAGGGRRRMMMMMMMMMRDAYIPHQARARGGYQACLTGYQEALSEIEKKNERRED